ncbi:hypothetical protein MMF93_07065 [Streptomyces tubbatahanensis]|uniref:Hydrolase n=1 Tax=Streptomyces tubbatahanensis TaxID=2923272 RepID=A0ABY3XPE5_9ACTN|nr:CocE/NonD family hydrolase [Streptomyces tubbatahanensis]UNS96285.1 hypothetical protein MMF93_07065 [Streptomyces tubbatahanensis]
MRRRPLTNPRSTARGPRLAGRQPAGASDRYPVRTEPDVRIPLPDGTALVGDLHRPVTSTPQPALLGWSPHNKDLTPTGIPAPFNEPGDVSGLAARGYPVLVVNARGTGRGGRRLAAGLPPEGRPVAQHADGGGARPHPGRAADARRTGRPHLQPLAVRSRQRPFPPVRPGGW